MIVYYIISYYILGGPGEGRRHEEVVGLRLGQEAPGP